MDRSSRPNVPDERPVELFVNGRPAGLFLCTPSDLSDLAVGSVFSRGMIENVGEIRRIEEPLETGDVPQGAGSGGRNFPAVRLELDHEPPAREFSLESVYGPARREPGQAAPGRQERPAAVGGPIPLGTLRRLASELFARARLHRQTGGVHCAGIARGDVLLLVREDVGRHNAVDKAIGAALRDGIDTSSCILILSGRISAAMLLKALRAEIPLAVTRHIPTGLALALAERRGMTLAGRIESERPIVYSHPERITET